MQRQDGALAGKVVLITGASSGIGLETARMLATMGAHIVVGARDPVRGRAVADELVGAGGSAEPLTIDLAAPPSVRAASAELAAAHPALDVLINNAGIVARRRRLNAAGRELTWATNFLGPFLLTELLLPALRAAPAARVVNVSSVAHRLGRLHWDDFDLARGYGYGGMRAYGQSKLALTLFTRELARREPWLAVNAVHPGGIATGIWRDAPAPVRWLLGRVLPPAAQGALPVVRLAAAPELAGVSGHYFDKLADVAPAAAARNDADAARLWEVAQRETARA